MPLHCLQSLHREPGYIHMRPAKTPLALRVTGTSVSPTPGRFETLAAADLLAHYFARAVSPTRFCIDRTGSRLPSKLLSQSRRKARRKWREGVKQEQRPSLSTWSPPNDQARPYAMSDGRIYHKHNIAPQPFGQTLAFRDTIQLKL